MTMTTELRYHLVLKIKAPDTKEVIEFTLGYKFRYEIANNLKLARNLMEENEAKQIGKLHGLLLFAEGIDTHTGASLGQHQAKS